MTNYTSLKTLWPTLSGTTDQKLAQVNIMTVTGPNVDVSVEQVVGFLLLQGVYPALIAFASGSTGSAQSLAAAKTLVAWITVPNAPILQMSNPTVFTEVQGMAEAVVAQETTSPGSTGFTQAVMNGLMALAASTTLWWQANGYTSPFSESDLEAAGGLT